MPSSYTQKITNLQEKIDSLPEGAVLPLRAQEFAGPIVIKRPLHLHGEGAMIRAPKGPVVTIQSASVMLRDLTIERTGESGGSPEEKAAILTTVQQDVRFANVEICGSVIGLPGEEGLWRYPLSFSLGRLTQNNSRDFQIPLTVPVACRVTSDRQAIFEVGPQTLTPEDKAINLYLTRFKSGEYVNGNIYLSTSSFRRSIMVHGYIVPPSAQLSPLAILKNGRCRIFLSYARPDQKKVRKLYEKLEKAGLEPWMDEKNLRGGINWEYAVEETMQNADFIVVCVSKSSIDRRGFIQKEIKLALDIRDRVPERDICVIPILLEKNCKIPHEFKKYNAVDLSARGGFEKLVKDINEEIVERDQEEEAKAKQARERPKRQPGAKKKQPEKVGASEEPTVPGISIVGGEFSSSTKPDAIKVENKRRLPIYLLVDCSEAMAGKPLAALRRCLKDFLDDLKGEAQFSEAAHLSVITFSNTAWQSCPLTTLQQFQDPTLYVSTRGGRALGAALGLLDECLEKEIQKPTSTAEGDWRPLVILFTSGHPTDRWEEVMNRVKQREFGGFITCAVNIETDLSMFQHMTDDVVDLDNLLAVVKFRFKWKSQPVAVVLPAPVLPPPPPRVTIVP